MQNNPDKKYQEPPSPGITDYLVVATRIMDGLDVLYESYKRRIKLECPVHGTDMKAVRHLRSSGRWFLECPDCNEEFVEAMQDE